ncbi:hypothetical protein G7Y89_g13549 [Cudoniella acicularis]|uniref:Zn(2)-C6 fungal-type domain-containing protein n=1 Tax=Cudoniella acicularis TaxID=354080 RepID=A0A8H4RAG7_9HELO|nr:hypothetical protein G7Y89_g13549 [Cudoniella acicularis]
MSRVSSANSEASRSSTNSSENTSYSSGAESPVPHKRLAWLTRDAAQKQELSSQAKRRHSLEPSQVNVYLECGRHRDEWLFGGFSVTSAIKKVLGGGRKDGEPSMTRRTTGDSQEGHESDYKGGSSSMINGNINATEAKFGLEFGKPSLSPSSDSSQRPASSQASYGFVSRQHPFSSLQGGFTLLDGNQQDSIYEMLEETLPAAKRACDACHRRKVKCDGINPCRNCSSAQLSCTYHAIPQGKPLPEKITLPRRLASGSATPSADLPISSLPNMPNTASYTEEQKLPQLLSMLDIAIPIHPSQESRELGRESPQSDGSLAENRSSDASNSTNSEDDTDWEDSDSNSAPSSPDFFLRNANLDMDSQSAAFASVQLSTAKAQLVDRLMEDFWSIFNQTWDHSLRRYGSTPESASNGSSPTPFRKNSSQERNGKRAREDEDDENRDGDNGRGSKRPAQLSDPPQAVRNTLRFACPFRKHDPRKYCVRDWARCALTPQPTISRVKGHLYKYHLIHQCQRCKHVFDSEQELDSHIEAKEGCESRTSGPVEGIPKKMKDQLRSRKKEYPGQTEAERWTQIYRILFPDESVPDDPYFEPVKDQEEEVPESPNATNLADYEAYLRRVLPRLVRRELEEAVNTDIQPIEEQLRSRIMNVIEGAQNQAFQSYRAIRNLSSDADSAQKEPFDSNFGAQDIGTCNISFGEVESQPRTVGIGNQRSTNFTYLPTSRTREGDGSIDSGYVSNPVGLDPSENPEMYGRSVFNAANPDTEDQDATALDDQNFSARLTETQVTSARGKERDMGTDMSNVNPLSGDDLSGFALTTSEGYLEGNTEWLEDGNIPMDFWDIPEGSWEQSL